MAQCSVGGQATSAFGVWTATAISSSRGTQRQADVAAPEGFEDAVAWLIPITGDQLTDDAPAHWSITFAVDDADAIADRAAKLGGSVVVPPMDAPWVRMTVISDPQGAVFTASKFTPPT